MAVVPGERPVISALWSSRARALVRSEATWLAVALIAYLSVHAQTIVPAFGEDDQVRLATDAIGWHLNGRITYQETDYRMRTSPLYIHGLKLAMQAGLPVRALPTLMNWLSLIASAACLLAVYLLVRPIAGRNVAAGTAGLLIFAPAFWLGGSYGMPHVPALACLLLALLLFAESLNTWETNRVRTASSWLAAMLAFFIALSLKADLVLTGLSFVGLALVKRKLTFGTFAAACGIVVVALTLQILYSHAAVASVPAAASSGWSGSLVNWARAWHQRFPFKIGALIDPKNLAPMTHSVGPFLFAASVLALLSHVVSKSSWRMGIWAASWSLPLLVFWGLIYGNSARHNLAVAPPLMAVTAFLIFRLAETPLRALIFGFGIVIANYFSDTVGDHYGQGTMVPRTNIVALSRDLQTKSRRLQMFARDVVKVNAPKKAVIDRAFLKYVAFEVVAAQGRLDRVDFDQKEIRIDRGKGGVQTVRLVRVNSQREASVLARKLRGQGYTVWSQKYAL